MRFYTHTHAFYAGVDLHARSMFTHILDNDGKTQHPTDSAHMQKPTTN